MPEHLFLNLFETRNDSQAEKSEDIPLTEVDHERA